MKTIAAADGTLPAFAKALASAGSVVDAFFVCRWQAVECFSRCTLDLACSWRVVRLASSGLVEMRERQRLSLPSSAGAVHALYLYGVHLVAAL